MPPTLFPYVAKHLQQDIERPIPGEAGDAARVRLPLIQHCRRTIRGLEAVLRLHKRFGFAGAWTVRERNQLHGVCFGRQAIEKREDG